jgi:hypothetical protein
MFGGEINTSGKGPSVGIGVATSGVAGGGSYGGSGGRNNCSSSSFSNVNFQVLQDRRSSSSFCHVSRRSEWRMY